MVGYTLIDGSISNESVPISTHNRQQEESGYDSLSINHIKHLTIIWLSSSVVVKVTPAFWVGHHQWASEKVASQKERKSVERIKSKNKSKSKGSERSKQECIHPYFNTPPACKVPIIRPSRAEALIEERHDSWHESSADWNSCSSFAYAHDIFLKEYMDLS